MVWRLMAIYDVLWNFMSMEERDGTQRTQPYQKHYGIVSYYAVVFLRRPPIFTTVWTPLGGEQCLQNPGKLCEYREVAIVNHCANVNLLRVVILIWRSVLVRQSPLGNCLKTSQTVVQCRKLSQIVVTFSFAVPFLLTRFGFCRDWSNHQYQSL